MTGTLRGYMIKQELYTIIEAMELPGGISSTSRSVVSSQSRRPPSWSRVWIRPVGKCITNASKTVCRAFSAISFNDPFPVSTGSKVIAWNCAAGWSGHSLTDTCAPARRHREVTAQVTPGPSRPNRRSGFRETYPRGHRVRSPRHWCQPRRKACCEADCQSRCRTRYPISPEPRTDRWLW